jgi:hypothetical protein
VQDEINSIEENQT